MPLIPEFKSFDDLVDRITLSESPVTFNIDPDVDFTSADVSPRLYSAIPALKKAGIIDPDKQLEVLDQVVGRSTQLLGQYIEQLPGGIYPDDVKKFKVEVIRPIVYKAINSIIHEIEEVEVPEKMSDVWNWTTRALYNSMLKKGKLGMKKTADGPATKIEPSVVEIDSAEDLTDDVPAVPDAPTTADVPDGDPVVTRSKGLDNNVVYDVDASAVSELTGIHRNVAEFIEDDSTGMEIMNSLGDPSRMVFNTPEAGGGLGGSRAKLKRVLDDLVTQGILMPQKSEEGDVVTVEPEPEDEHKLQDRDWARSELDRAYRAGLGGIQMA